MKNEENTFKSIKEFEKFFKQRENKKKLHQICEKRLETLLKQLFPESYITKESWSLPGQRSDLLLYSTKIGIIHFEIIATINQIPTDLRILERSNADYKFAILLDEILNPKLMNKYFHQKPEGTFYWFRVSEIFLKSKEKYFKKKLIDSINISKEHLNKNYENSIIQFYTDLKHIWSREDISIKSKINLSSNLYESHYGKYDLTNVTDTKYNQIKLINIFQEHNVEYHKNGNNISETKILTHLYNISKDPIKSERIILQGVIPVFNDKKLKLKITDKDNNDINWNICKNSNYNEKLVNIIFPKELEKNDDFIFKCQYFWEYPISKKSRIRWYTMSLKRFTTELNVKIILPEDMTTTNVDIRKGNNFSSPWEDIIEKIEPKNIEGETQIHWQNKIFDGNKPYKIYYTTKY